MITDITLNNDTFAEGTVNGTIVGTFTVIDDVVPQTHTIVLLDDADNRFKLDGNYLIVRDTTKIDYETDTSHNITLRAIDENDSLFDKVFTINITDSTLAAVIHSIDPKASKEGTNPLITIKGQHFSEGGEPTVRIDGDPVSITSYTDNEITFVLIDNLPASVYTLSVFNGMGL